MDEGENSYQDILQENFYLFSRYIVAEDFLETLISASVLTVDDKEVITNRLVHQNRRQRANKLIEILMTRGEAGYLKFLEVLEYQYPHVYQEVTKKQPRDPPVGFSRNRFSDRLRMIQNLPILLDQMKLQVEQNSEIEHQLCVLQQLLEVSREENTALEKEVEMLKNIRCDNQQLSVKVKSLETENYQHQLTINTWTTKAFQLMETQNEHRDKCQELQASYDLLYKQYTDLQKQTSAEKSQQASKNSPPPVPKRVSPPGVDHGSHYKARVEILEHELENHKTQCEDLTARLMKTSDDVRALEEELEKVNKELRKVTREKETLKKQHTDISVKNESYYKTIQKKNDEIIELQNRSMFEQQRITDLIREKKNLFEENHKLESDLQELRGELEKMKARLSGSSLEFTGSSLEQGTSGSEAEVDSEDNAPIVNRKIQVFDGLDLGHQCQSVYKRRKVVKKHYTSEVHARKLAKQAHVSDHVTDGGDVSYKANTLPMKSVDSPERLFQREVAHFRYTRKREISESMKVNHGSVVEGGNLPSSFSQDIDDYGIVESNQPVPLPAEMFPDKVYDNVSKREPIVHPRDEDEAADNASTSTVYIPRTSNGSQEKVGPQAGGVQGLGQIFRSLSQGSARVDKKNKPTRVPTGGKSYKKDDIQRSNSVESRVLCNSIANQSDSSSDSNIISDFSSHDVHTALLPKDCLVVSKPPWTDKNMIRQIKVKYSNLGDKVEFKGGNHTGIFITKVNKQNDQLREGEQIQGIILTPSERIKPVKTEVKGCTLENFLSLVRGDFINKKKEKEIILEVRSNKQEYDSAREWMDNNGGHGDYFFIRCNAVLDNKREDVVNLKPRDVFLVQNSCFDEDYWQGHLVDPATGKASPNLSLIPNLQKANLKRFTYGRAPSTEEEEKGKRGGLKVKGHVYDRVLPMKASTKLPVDILGADSQLVAAFLDLISANLSDKFIVGARNTDCLFDADAGEEKELYRHDMHIVQEGRVDSLRSRKAVKRITLLVSVTTVMTINDTRKLFGESSQLELSQGLVSQCEIIRQKLLDSGQHFEEICLSSEATKDSLLHSFQTCVDHLQDRILWLSCSEMDEQVANRYPSYLGQLCDLSKIQAQLHHSQSSDQS